MRELKILAVVIALTLITYIGVEPFAHSQMHPHVDEANYTFDKADEISVIHAIENTTKEIEKAKESIIDADSYTLEDYILMFFGKEINLEERKKSAEQNLVNATQLLKDLVVAKKDILKFWENINKVTSLKGNSENGASLVQSNCIACHSITTQDFPPLMDDATSAASYGVVPPDLSSSGKIYDANYLAAFISNPAKASKVSHKFVDGKVHPMPNYDWMQPQEIADMVAYLQSIAPKEMTNKEVFVDACQRCHAMKYADMKKGTMQAKTPDENIKAYMGKLPPDLSQYIRSRSESYLHEFVNDPQKHLEGTAMPRVGLTKIAEDQVVTYMQEVGDSKKSEREALGPKFLIYLVIFAIFAWLWKASKWRELH